MAFLHGVDFIKVTAGAVPVTEVKSSIIGLVGTAPIGGNGLAVISNARQAEETYGKQVPNFTIPQALASIFAQGPARVIVVNVFESANNDHINTATAEVVTMVGGKAKTVNAPIGAIVLTNSAGSTTYVAGSDYVVDAYGNIQVVNYTNIAANASLKATYNYLDTAGITSAVVIGTSSPKTGLKLFSDSMAVFGYQPKILIAPKYCEIAGVATEMIAQATALEGVALIDSPSGKTVAEIVTARGPGGTLPGFNSSSKRVLLMYPYLKAYDPATDATALRPYSPFFAGAMAQNDRINGYWASASNKEILGIVGVERNLSAGLSDEDSEVNQLNEVGVITVFNAFGTGIRTWGNRSAAFPSVTTPDNFYSVQRVQDILHESVKFAMLQFIDRPINQALIDAIKQTVNAFIRSLIQRGAVVDGECVYNVDNNPPVEIAAGHLTFDISFMPPTPAERITFTSFIDINLLSVLA